MKTPSDRDIKSFSVANTFQYVERAISKRFPTDKKSLDIRVTFPKGLPMFSVELKVYNSTCEASNHNLDVALHKVISTMEETLRSNPNKP